MSKKNQVLSLRTVHMDLVEEPTVFDDLSFGTNLTNLIMSNPFMCGMSKFYRHTTLTLLPYTYISAMCMINYPLFFVKWNIKKNQ